MATHRLPLFPLRVVLLPAQHLPLHIFEERYKTMIGECLRGDAPFGVVLAERGGIRKVGCAARIVEVLERFADGRMNILVRGEWRFALLRTYERRPYLEGEAEEFHDEAEAAQGLCRRLWDALREGAHAHPNLPEEVRTDPHRLSFAAADALRLPLPERQAFLESRSPRWRLGRLLELAEGKRAREFAASAHKRLARRNGRP